MPYRSKRKAEDPPSSAPSPMAAMYKPQNTGILYNADEGFGSTFQGDGLLPRSIASDGRRTVLIFHVLVHVLALAANIVSCVYMYEIVPRQTR